MHGTSLLAHLRAIVSVAHSGVQSFRYTFRCGLCFLQKWAPLKYSLATGMLAAVYGQPRSLSLIALSHVGFALVLEQPALRIISDAPPLA